MHLGRARDLRNKRKRYRILRRVLDEKYRPIAEMHGWIEPLYPPKTLDPKSW